MDVCWFEVKGEIECLFLLGVYIFIWWMYLDNLQGWYFEFVYFIFLKNDDENIECKCYIDFIFYVLRL